LEGWDNLCGSLTSLKHLVLQEVDLVGITHESILSALPTQVPASLETLGVVNLRHPKVTNGGTPWLDACSTPLTSLRTLEVGRITVETMENICNRYPKLEGISCHVMTAEPHETRNDDKYLETFLQLASHELETLKLIGGSYSEQALDKFIAAFPDSVKCLELSSSRGLTPSILCALLKLPLRELSVEYAWVAQEFKREMERISESQRPLELKIFKWMYLPLRP
jgi:hypothetical protein